MAVSISTGMTVKSYSGSSPVITGAGDTYWINWNTSGTSTSTAKSCLPYKSGTAYAWGDLESAWYDGAACRVADSRMLSKGRNYELPDGARLRIDDHGNYKIEDADAKVTYRANRLRDFSPHLNASDMVAKFIEYVAGLGVRRDELLKLPLQLFINWLVIEAAERDDDPLPPDVVQVASHPDLKAIIAPKCLCCGRFIKRLHVAHRFPFCTPEHGAVYVQRKQLPARIEHVEALPAIAQ